MLLLFCFFLLSGITSMITHFSPNIWIHCPPNNNSTFPFSCITSHLSQPRTQFSHFNYFKAQENPFCLSSYTYATKQHCELCCPIGLETMWRWRHSSSSSRIKVIFEPKWYTSVIRVPVPIPCRSSTSTSTLYAQDLSRQVDETCQQT